MDLDTINKNTIFYKKGILTVNSGGGKWFPIYGDKPLLSRQFFTVEVDDAAAHYFAIGLATGDLKNSTSELRNVNSCCIKAEGFMYVEGNIMQRDFRVRTGDVVGVRRTVERVEWVCNNKVVCGAQISKRLANLQLFPVCWIYSGNIDKHVSRLKIV